MASINKGVQKELPGRRQLRELMGMVVETRNWRVLRPLLLFVVELSLGGRVFYTRSTGLRVPAKVVGLLHNGHVELEYDQGGVWVVNYRCPRDAISFAITRGAESVAP